MNMQHQTQGQPPGHQHIASSSRNRASWHAEGDDVPDRRLVIAHVLKLFQKNNSTAEYQQRLPEMVRRLEEGLYRDAASKEEYNDMNTLEKRIQSVAKRISAGRNTAANSRNTATMIPTPGAATMIPTPGLATSPASFSGAPGQFAMPGSRRNNLAVSTAPSNSLVSHSGAGGVRMVQQGSNMVTSAQMHPSLVNGRLDSPFIGNGGQYSLNGNAMHSSSSYFGQGQIQREGFQIHKSLNGEIPSSQSSKMIPVPGLPSQLQQRQSEATTLQEQKKTPNQNQKKADVVRVQNGVATAQDSLQNGLKPGDGTANGMSGDKKEMLRRQQHWLCLLRHANKCTAPEGQCNFNSRCHYVQQVLRHATKCRETACQSSHCQVVRALLRHHSQCENLQCALCAPARRLARAAAQAATIAAASSSAVTASTCTEETQVAAKRVKEEVDIQSYGGVGAGSDCGPPFPKKIKVEPGTTAQVKSAGICKGKGPIVAQQVDVKPCVLPDGQDDGMLEAGPSMESSALVAIKEEVGHSSNNVSLKSGKSKVVGISLLELFSKEQILEHFCSIRLWTGQSKAKAEKHQAMEQQPSENACRICAVERLTFEPPPLYCTTCGVRLKRNSVYYTAGSGETRHYFCIPCYNASPADTVGLDGQLYPKSKLEKKKNDEETEEAWVQCDKCNVWQHQICALFNGRRNEGGDTEFICPYCLLNDMESGDRTPLPLTAVLGAKDLPKTLLSDHLEQRLARSLRKERADRAEAQGKSFEEVPGAEGLVVRVVSSVDKKLEVKQRFLEIFKDSNYPSEYLYKSKVVLLFQRIEGVEVCLFGMYVQEFGAECPEPNNRRLYIAYLDSVKYFRPEVKTVTGEALRTFVYHEILIGYLEYCKRRGFGSCYIWACPPLRGEDYILYCHPEIQKTPKSDKLREWYLAMLGKATKENIVVELTNFYDYFFISPDECKAHVTAARLPYFDGDYWPGAAEEVLLQLHQDEEDKRRLHKKGISKKGVAKRIGAQSEPSSNASKDLQLMHKLGQAISPLKEDFILVHMHHSCRHCRLFITSECRWVCKQCKNFHLCNRCYVADQKRDEKDRHPWNSRETHELFAVEVNDIPAETEDKDEIMESEFFDTRQAFLSLCQGNHYQHDTLRRAKHSSMMVLYHLHNPTAPAFVTSCNICNQDIETGKGWRCDTCADFDLCAACYHKELPKHPHKLKPQLSVAERNAQNKEARQQRVVQLRKIVQLLIHSSQCCSFQCQYPKCRKVKNLFRHGTVCKTRASGGCRHCKLMWHLLQLHARSCKESDCRVPRCKDLKEHGRRSQQQAESRRRAALMELLKQRAQDGSSSATS
ncbi:histone acetyltransferase HAC1 [Selaginella moellendorffii]|nr:histone acetyltransferase HAC1 [Selaginella moellendorffii]|eukprot:XP_024524723.1 histone acetyltransferase HAC1 [Selaginella moellendorffii]